MKWLALSNLPFAVVSDPSFQAFCNDMNPRFNVKDSTAFARHKLPLLYDTLVSARNDLLLDELPDCKQVAITFDHWSSRNNDPFLCLTLHYINKDFVLRKMTVAIVHHPETHTGSEIADMIQRQLEEIPPLLAITRIVCVVDQAANMRKAINDADCLLSLDNGSICCMDHKLNTALGSSWDESADLKAAMDAAKVVTSKLHQSYKCEGILKGICARRGTGNIKITISNFLIRYFNDFLIYDTIFYRVFNF